MLIRLCLTLLLVLSLFAGAEAAQMQKRVSQSDLETLTQELTFKELAIRRWDNAIEEARAEGNEERAQVFMDAKARAQAEIAPARAALEEAQARYKRQRVEETKP